MSWWINCVWIGMLFSFVGLGGLCCLFRFGCLLSLLFVFIRVWSVLACGLWLSLFVLCLRLFECLWLLCLLIELVLLWCLICLLVLLGVACFCVWCTVVCFVCMNLCLFVVVGCLLNVTTCFGCLACLFIEYVMWILC